MSDLDYGMMSEHDAEGVVAVLSYAFNETPEGSRKWLERHDRSCVRVVRTGTRVDACALLLPMGQFFGGRAVPMFGIAGVGTAPTARGGGAATVLMRSIVRELHHDGVPISTLYPATQSLYRRAGYEQAGALFQTDVAPENMPRARDTGVTVRACEPADESAVRALGVRMSRHRNGSIERSDLMWLRIREPQGNPAHAFVFERHGAITGYAFFTKERNPGRLAKHQLIVYDLEAEDGQTMARLLTFFADHGSLVTGVSFLGGASEPVLGVLDEQRYTVALRDYWMTCLTDVPRALVARGYPAGLTASVVIRVEDDVIDTNAGTYAITVADGRAKVKRTDDPTPGATLHARALATLYTSFRSAHALRETGLLEADDASLDALTSIFAGPAPAMREMF